MAKNHTKRSANGRFMKKASATRKRNTRGRYAKRR
jgi:hypothetical protein